MCSRKTSVQSTLITTFGLKRNEYSGAFTNVITMDELFDSWELLPDETADRKSDSSGETGTSSVETTAAQETVEESESKS